LSASDNKVRTNDLFKNQNIMEHVAKLAAGEGLKPSHLGL